MESNMESRVESRDFYLVKDLARASGLSIHTVKYYLKIGLLREKGRSPETNFRYFDDSALHHLHRICALRREGKSIRDIQSLLKERE